MYNEVMKACRSMLVWLKLNQSILIIYSTVTVKISLVAGNKANGIHFC